MLLLSRLLRLCAWCPRLACVRHLPTSVWRPHTSWVCTCRELHARLLLLLLPRVGHARLLLLLLLPGVRHAGRLLLAGVPTHRRHSKFHRAQEIFIYLHRFEVTLGAELSLLN